MKVALPLGAPYFKRQHLKPQRPGFGHEAQDKKIPSCLWLLSKPIMSLNRWCFSRQDDASSVLTISQPQAASPRLCSHLSIECGIIMDSAKSTNIESYIHFTLMSVSQIPEPLKWLAQLRDQAFFVSMPILRYGHSSACSRRRIAAQCPEVDSNRSGVIFSVKCPPIGLLEEAPPMQNRFAYSL
jgi:hypothetical protein